MTFYFFMLLGRRHDTTTPIDDSMKLHDWLFIYFPFLPTEKSIYPLDENTARRMCIYYIRTLVYSRVIGFLRKRQ